MKEKNGLLLSGISILAVFAMAVSSASAQDLDGLGDFMNDPVGAAADSVQTTALSPESEVTTDSNGNMTILPNASIKKNLVVSGNLSIGGASDIEGNVTVSGNLTAGANVTITGSVKVEGTVTLGDQFDVGGNLEARNANLSLGNNYRVGGGVITKGLVTGANGDIVGPVTVLGASPVVIGVNNDFTNTLTASGGLKIGTNSDVKLFLSGKTAVIDGKEYKLGGTILERGANTNVGLPVIPKPKATSTVQYGQSAVQGLPAQSVKSIAETEQSSAVSQGSGALPMKGSVADQVNGIIDATTKDMPTITLPNDLGEISLSNVANASAKAAIQQGDFSVDTDEEIVTSGGEIFIATKSGQKIPVVVSPVGVTQKVGVSKEEIIKMSLGVENDKPVYTITGNEEKKFLWMFKVAVPFLMKTDAQTGDVISNDTPWWSAFTF